MSGDFKGFVGVATRELVAGWAVDLRKLNAAIQVSILVDGQHVGDTIADLPRPDLARTGEFGEGQHGFRFTFSSRLSAKKPHLVCVRFAETGMLLPGGERLVAAAEPPPPSIAPALMPILVTGAGRTGTTLLMSLLAQAPEIVAAERLPLETRLLAYYANALNVLTHAADPVHSTHQDHVPGDGYHIGFNPYHCAEHEAAFSSPVMVRDLAEHYAPARLEAAFADVVTEYYRRLARDRGKGDVRFFAEKNFNLQQLVRSFTRKAFGGVREIITLRDPRDIMCSYISYFKIDGAKAFADLTHATKTILAIHEQNPDDVFFCRYERLLRGDDEFLAELSAFTGATISQRSQASRSDMFARHGTSANPLASIGRWRADLPTEWRERCTIAWQPFLVEFSYSLE